MTATRSRRDYLSRCAEENPGLFLALLGKLLPMQVTGDEGDLVSYTIITSVRGAGDPEEASDR